MPEQFVLLKQFCMQSKAHQTVKSKLRECTITDMHRLLLTNTTVATYIRTWLSLRYTLCDNHCYIAYPHLKAFYILLYAPSPLMQLYQLMTQLHALASRDYTVIMCLKLILPYKTTLQCIIPYYNYMYMYSVYIPNIPDLL